MKVAVAWLLKEDWPEWQAIDSQLPDYANWLIKIEGAEARANALGTETERVIVKPDEFVKWCKVNGMPIDRNSRATYAAQQLSIRSTMN